MTVTVFQRSDYSPLKTYIALVLWPGMVHFSFAVILLSILMFPSLFSFIVLGILSALTVSPLPSNSHLGRFICKYCCGYFPMTVHVEDIETFDRDQAYVFAYEPHSILGIGVIALSNFSELLPFKKVRVMAANVALNIPLVRQMWSCMGFVHATHKNFVSSLQNGYSCVVVPGGVGEIFHLQLNYETILLKPRQGFIRVAMETGRPLVPVFAFGQSQVYEWWKAPKRLGTWFYNLTKFPLILNWGLFGPIPYRRPMHIVVGIPIPVKRNSKPTAEEVDQVHENFIEAMQEMFERHKTRIGFDDLQLKVI